MDRSTVEDFAGDGRVVTSARVFPPAGADRVSLETTGPAALRHLAVHPPSR